MLGFAATLHAQQVGQIRGQIVDSQTGEELIGAQVLTQEGQGTLTDFDGAFVILGLKPGNYSLIVSYLGYRTDTLRDLKLAAGQALNVTIRLVSESISLEDVEIVAQRATIESSNIAIVATLRDNQQVAVGISKDQISATQDRDGAQVMRRLPGISLANDRFVIIRGLSERYSMVMLNRTVPPSLEPDVRAFSFDILPAGLLEQVLVTKTPSPELPADFAGGIIQIKTLAIPERNLLTFSYQTSYRVGTTFGDFLLDPARSGTDLLGFDNGNRALPDAFPPDRSTFNRNSVAQRSTLGRELPNAWSGEDATAPLDQRLNVLFARKVSLGNKTLGLTTALRHSLTHQYYEARWLNYQAFDENLGYADTIFDVTDQFNERSASLGVLQNLTFKLSPMHTLDFNLLFNQQGSNQIVTREGLNLQTNFESVNYALRYRQRSLLNVGVGGIHYLKPDKLKLDWTAGYGRSGYDEPAFRQVGYGRPRGSNTPYLFAVSPGGEISAGASFFAGLTENIYSGQANFEYRLTEATAPSGGWFIRLGGMTEIKRRNFDARWFSFIRSPGDDFDDALLELPVNDIFAPQNIAPRTGFTLIEGTRVNDRYTAESEIYAAYAAINIPITRMLNAYVGGRMEHSRQFMSSFEFGAATLTPITSELEVTRFLPSAALTYRFSQQWQLRANYGQSLNRPEFRELAPFFYYDFYQNYILRGNPDLKIPIIQHADLRAEWYPNPGEMVTVGVFGKHFRDPIEWAFIGNTSPEQRNYTYQNASQAVNYGAEIEVRKNIVRDFFFLFNAAYIFTEIELAGADSITLEQARRPMQGQSPYLLNAGLSYDNTKLGLTVNAFYNVFGPRLIVAGVFGNPGVYQMPRHVVDLNVRKQLGKFVELMLGVQDLLNASFIWRQDNNGDDRIESSDDLISEFRMGQYVTLGLKLNF